MSVCAVTDLPQPDSPTIANTSPFSKKKIRREQLELPRIRPERNSQIFHFKQIVFGAHHYSPLLTCAFWIKRITKPIAEQVEA